jgi:tetratricopeptide (TPR) repeat protein
MRYLTAAVALRPRNLSVRDNLGASLENQGRWSEAAAQYREAVRIREDEPDLHVNLGNVLQRMGRHKEAATEFGRALQLKPDHPTAQKCLDSALKAMESPSTTAIDKAMDAERKASPVNPAVADRAEASAPMPKDAGSWIEQGNGFLTRREHENAVAAFSRAIELASQDASIHLSARTSRGVAYMALRDYEKAVADFSRTIELNPGNTWSWTDRGRAYLQLGRHKLALADFSKAIGMDAKFDPAWFQRGLAYSGLNEFRKALDDFREASRLRPDKPDVHDALARLLADCPHTDLRDPLEAVRRAERATELRAGNYEYWNTLGLAHYRNGDAKAAIAALETALTLPDGGNAVSFFLLAMAHGMLGHLDEARTWYDKSVAWQNEYEKSPSPDQRLLEHARRFRIEAEDVLGLKKK